MEVHNLLLVLLLLLLHEELIIEFRLIKNQRLFYNLRRLLNCLRRLNNLLVLVRKVVRVHHLLNSVLLDVLPIDLVASDQLALYELIGSVVIILVGNGPNLQNLNLFLDILLELSFDIEQWFVRDWRLLQVLFNSLFGQWLQEGIMHLPFGYELRSQVGDVIRVVIDLLRAFHKLILNGLGY